MVVAIKMIVVAVEVIKMDILIMMEEATVVASGSSSYQQLWLVVNDGSIGGDFDDKGG